MTFLMNLLPKEIFISTLDCLREQTLKDIDASNAISKVFATDAVYDNSLLIRATIKLLQVFFPKGENGFCEIEHYCFDMNFGKIDGRDLITSEDLWDRLDRIEVVDSAYYKQYPLTIKESFKGVLYPINMTSTHPLIDDNPKSDGV